MTMQEKDDPQDEDRTSMPCHPSTWPQRPLMIRPTPNTTTQVMGIRFAAEANVLENEGFANSCCLPINGGQEKLGRSLVVEFQSSHFVGELIVRIKDAPRFEGLEYQTGSYFDGKKRTFQAVVRGRFKIPLPMRNCLTGQTFRRAGKLPARWIVNSFLKIISLLAPHLEVTLGGNQPRFLAPLSATAQTVLVERDQDSVNSNNLEKKFVEPLSTNRSSILWEEEFKAVDSAASKPCESVASRIKKRKKFFNSVATTKEESPYFSTQNTYVFEFYQHMLDFKDDIRIKMGKPVGNVSVSQITDGQPIKFMSAYQDQNTKDLEYLWSFDIWHESFFQFAELAHNQGR